MPGPTEKYHITDILKAKKENLLLIFKIAEKQENLLGNDDVETLVKAIEARQKLIDEISVLDRYIEENNLKNDASYKEEASQKLLSEIKGILGEIAEKDRDNIKSAEDKVEEYKHQIRDIKKDKNRIASYYGAPDAGDGIYIDKKK